MNYSDVTPRINWQCIKTWRELGDPTSETPCGQCELWMPPMGHCDARDLDNIITDSGVCVFVILPEHCEVKGLHGKYQTKHHTSVTDGILSLCDFGKTPEHYGIYFTP